jgi:lysozyme family protein
MEQADAIFKTEYWDTIGGDAMPMGVDLVSFDVSVNSGSGKARQWYVDARAASQQPLEQIRTICTRRLSFMHGLRAWSQFGKGWAARVSACEAKAIVMASKALSLHPNTTIQTLGVEAGASKTKATKTAKVAVVSGGGGAVTTADAATAGHTGKVIAFIMIAALVGMCVVLVIKAMQHQQRAEAMDTEAKGVV